MLVRKVCNGRRWSGQLWWRALWPKIWPTKRSAAAGSMREAQRFSLGGGIGTGVRGTFVRER